MPWPPTYIGTNQVIQDIVDKINGGSSFPASPSTGTTYFRTDIGQLCYYDGTRWLTVNEYEWTTLGVTGGGVFSFTADATYALLTSIRRDYQPYFSRVAVVAQVATTNNGSNYWTITANSHNSIYGGGTILKTFNTSAAAVNTWVRYEYAAGSLDNTVPSDYGTLGYGITKSGSPGTLFLTGSVYYRLIIT